MPKVTTSVSEFARYVAKTSAVLRVNACRRDDLAVTSRCFKAMNTASAAAVRHVKTRVRDVHPGHCVISVWYRRGLAAPWLASGWYGV